MKTAVHKAHHKGEKSQRDPHAQRTDGLALAAIAHRVMIERGLEPDFPAAARQELAVIHDLASAAAGVRDLRD